MNLDTGWDEEHGVLAESLAGFCREVCPDERLRESVGLLPRDLWQGLAELGIFEAAVPGADAGPCELVTAMEALGYAAFPGPLIETVFGCGVLGGETLRGLVAGECIVSVAMSRWLPWGSLADVFIDREIDVSGQTRAWLAEPRGGVEAVATLGGEPWGRGDLERGEELEGADRAAANSELARAAYLAAAGRRLVAAASDHARTRRQFGRAIGEFQAVAHPLADVHMRLTGARLLVRSAARAFDGAELDDAIRARVAAARLSAEGASLEAVQTCHQVFGAIGITLEGPAFHVSRRIRHRVSASAGAQAAREAVLRDLGLGGEGV